MVVCQLESVGDCDLLSSMALPRGVRVTLDSFVLPPLSSWMRLSINASSQTECLGHVVRQASIPLRRSGDGLRSIYRRPHVPFSLPLRAPPSLGARQSIDQACC